MSNSDRLFLKSKIIEISESNSIYMTIKTVLVSDDVNFNDAQFLEEFIDGVIDNKDKYVGIPFQVNRMKIEGGMYDTLNHELNRDTGELNTDTIGSFIDFHKEEIEGANCLIGTARVYKRYPKTCEAILDLYESGDLETSVEALISTYKDKKDGIRKIGYEGNEIIAQCIVTYGAESRAKPHYLVAQAIQSDLKGGEKMSKEFNNGKEINYHFENASIKLSDIGNQIYNIVNPVDSREGYREYNYFILDIYNDHVILEHFDKHDECYKASYKIENDAVALSSKVDWVKGYIGFIPSTINIETLIAEYDEKIEGLNKEVDELKTQHEEVVESMSKDNKLTEKELAEKVEALEVSKQELKDKVAELNDVIIAKKEEVDKAVEKQEELASTVEELKPFKDRVEAAEKEAKKNKLVEKFSKVFSKETLDSERVQTAFEELNEVELSSIAVEEILSSESTDTDENEEIEVSASQTKQLLPENDREKWYSSKE